MFNESSCVCVVTLPDDAVLPDVLDVDVPCALAPEAAEPVAGAESPSPVDDCGDADPESAPVLDDVDVADAAESLLPAVAPIAVVAVFVFVVEFAAGKLELGGVDNKSELELEEADFETVNNPAACAVASAVSLSDDGTN